MCILLLFLNVSFTNNTPGFNPVSQAGELSPEICSSERYDSLDMKFVGNLPFGPSFAAEIDSARNLVFCGSGGGVYLLDISDPSNPVKLSDIRTRGVVEKLFYESSNERLYIAAGKNGLEIWNVASSGNPKKLGTYDTPGEAYGVDVFGNYAYVADHDSGFRVIDISTPESPEEVGFCGTPSYAQDVTISDSYAYVADLYYGLRVIDISTPEDPEEVGFFDTPGVAENVVISDSFAYVADFFEGLRIINISTPSNPFEVGAYDTLEVWDVTISGNYAFAASPGSGLRVIDISSPEDPSEVGFFDTPGFGMA